MKKHIDKLIDEVYDLIEVTDETISKYELLERFYNEAYNQGWSDCFWKSIKKQK